MPRTQLLSIIFLTAMMVTQATCNASGALLLYDGFSAGGATPGADQYETGTGYPGDALNDGNGESGTPGTQTGQSPVLTGFSGSAPWTAPASSRGQFAETVYPQALSSSLNYSDGTDILIGG